MLTNDNPANKRKISKVVIDTDNSYIELCIKEGYVNDSVFTSDGRPAIKIRIANIPDKDAEQIDVDLIVDVNNQVTLTKTPLDNNQVIVNGIPQDHTTGQLVTCSGYTEHDIVTISYYYIQSGRNWFNESASYIRDSNFDGLTDYEYISKRLWSIALEMGLVQGTLV